MGEPVSVAFRPRTSPSVPISAYEHYVQYLLDILQAYRP